MAFQSYDELIKMASRNPKQATDYVQAAQRSNRPVVSADNPGYGEDPRQRVLKRALKKSTEQDEVVQERKSMTY